MENKGSLLGIKRVLAFARRRHFTRIESLAWKLFGSGVDIQLVSDERLGGSDVQWWGRYFYRNLNDVSVRKYYASLPIEEIVQRCRYLRFMPKTHSERLVTAAFKTWEQILEEGGYQIVLLLPIDSFILDTLERAANQLGIPAISPIATLFPGRIRFTVRGELRGYIKATEETERLFSSVIQSLSSLSFKPDFLIGASTSVKKTAVRRIVIDCLKRPAFWCYRVLMNDPLSYSFAPWSSQRGRMIASADRVREFFRLEHQSTLNFPKKFVLIPLQFYPESTNDYWIPELEMCDHHTVTLTMAKVLSEKYPVVIKEHPACIGRRDAKVLRDLSKLPNVFFAPTMYPIADLVKRAELVVGYASSSVLQAMVLGAPILYCGTPYYGATGFQVVTGLKDSNRILEQVNDAISRTVSSNDRIANLKRIFSSTASGSLGSFAPIGESLVRKESESRVSEEMIELFERAVTLRESDHIPDKGYPFGQI